MNAKPLVHAIVIPVVLLSGCSTKPRNFAASISTPVSDRTAFESDYRTCAALVKSGRTSGFRSAASSAAVGAGAVGSGLAVGAAVGTGGVYSGWGGVGAAAGTAAAAATVVAGLVGFGITRAIRGGREHKYKSRMAECLDEFGYSVSDWQKLPKKADAAHYAADKAASGTFIPPVGNLGETETPPLTEVSSAGL